MRRGFSLFENTGVLKELVTMSMLQHIGPQKAPVQCSLQGEGGNTPGLLHPRGWAPALRWAGPPPLSAARCSPSDPMPTPGSASGRSC